MVLFCAQSKGRSGCYPTEQIGGSARRPVCDAWLRSVIARGLESGPGSPVQGAEWLAPARNPNPSCCQSSGDRRRGVPLAAQAGLLLETAPPWHGLWHLVVRVEQRCCHRAVRVPGKVLEEDLDRPRRVAVASMFREHETADVHLAVAEPVVVRIAVVVDLSGNLLAGDDAGGRVRGVRAGRATGGMHRRGPRSGPPRGRLAAGEVRQRRC